MELVLKGSMYVAGLPHRKRHQQPAEGGDAQQIVMPGAMWQFWRARGTFEGGNQLPSGVYEQAEDHNEYCQHDQLE